MTSSPKPWTVETKYSPYSVYVLAADGRFVANSSWHDDSPHYPTKVMTLENFLAIARAVNFHAVLLAAAKRALSEAVADEMDGWYAELKAVVACAEEEAAAQR